jgi:hypothetical protein
VTLSARWVTLRARWVTRLVSQTPTYHLPGELFLEDIDFDDERATPSTPAAAASPRVATEPAHEQTVDNPLLRQPATVDNPLLADGERFQRHSKKALVKMMQAERGERGHVERLRRYRADGSRV